MWLLPCPTLSESQGSLNLSFPSHYKAVRTSRGPPGNLVRLYGSIPVMVWGKRETPREPSPDLPSGTAAGLAVSQTWNHRNGWGQAGALWGSDPLPGLPSKNAGTKCCPTTTL